MSTRLSPEPLRRLVEANPDRRVLIENMGKEGSTYHANLARRITDLMNDKAKFVMYHVADKICLEFGTHPSNVYGEAWTECMPGRRIKHRATEPAPTPMMLPNV